jgi:hypothetical protein
MTAHKSKNAARTRLRQQRSIGSNALISKPYKTLQNAYGPSQKNTTRYTAEVLAESRVSRRGKVLDAPKVVSGIGANQFCWGGAEAGGSGTVGLAGLANPDSSISVLSSILSMAIFCVISEAELPESISKANFTPSTSR